MRSGCPAYRVSDRPRDRRYPSYCGQAEAHLGEDWERERVLPLARFGCTLRKARTNLKRSSPCLNANGPSGLGWSRRVRFMILGAAVVAAVCGSATAASASIGAPSSHTYTVTVQGNDASLTDSGIAVSAGKMVQITASGEISYNTQGGKSTPAGYPVPGEICASGVSAGWYNANLNCLSLIGRFGSGEVFQVGDSVTIPHVAGGELYFIYNDNDYADNSGHFTVKVTVS